MLGPGVHALHAVGGAADWRVHLLSEVAVGDVDKVHARGGGHVVHLVDAGV